ncbi:GNAT family N-acetyltransferase [Nonlabens ponticola]|uniref:N-acetyltransferase n=1 Tax=Nonlabens ponticola TaxID=2496866 RepID=A0A3S9MUL0_9FLAO|nr:GNAT family N-acetyltransferase [Nonlabens ponticola]AZQ42862.1 N-acetyltransferase [Nonlabens ponticola]
MNLAYETDRLLMRPYKLNDAPFLFEMNNDAEVMKYTGDVSFDNLLDAEEYLTDYTENPKGQVKKYGMGRFAAIEKNTGDFIGISGVKIHEASQICDLGYRLLKRHWGKGFATEMAAASLKFGFEICKQQEIVAHVHEYNLGSQRVVDKLGFTLAHRFLWDGQLPGRYYTMTREQYDNQRN